MRLNQKFKSTVSILSITIGMLILFFSAYLGYRANERLLELQETNVSEISVLFAITKLVEVTKASVIMFKFGIGISILLILSNIVAIFGALKK